MNVHRQSREDRCLRSQKICGVRFWGFGRSCLLAAAVAFAQDIHAGVIQKTTLKSGACIAELKTAHIIWCFILPWKFFQANIESLPFILLNLLQDERQRQEEQEEVPKIDI